MKFRRQRKYFTYLRRIKKGEFRVTREELREIARRGTELLLNATPDDLKTFRKWE